MKDEVGNIIILAMFTVVAVAFLILAWTQTMTLVARIGITVVGAIVLLGVSVAAIILLKLRTG